MPCGWHSVKTAPPDRKLTMTDDTIIHTPGRPDIHVLPRDNGGVMLTQRKNRIWMSAAEVAQLIDIIKGNIENHRD